MLLVCKLKKAVIQDSHPHFAFFAFLKTRAYRHFGRRSLLFSSRNYFRYIFKVLHTYYCLVWLSLSPVWPFLFPVRRSFGPYYRPVGSCFCLFGFCCHPFGTFYLARLAFVLQPVWQPYSPIGQTIYNTLSSSSLCKWTAHIKITHVVTYRFLEACLSMLEALPPLWQICICISYLTSV